MTAQDAYLLDRTEAEYARLRLQAQVWEPATRGLLAAAGLAPGMRCLDAGCGPGAVMQLMAGMVGPGGHVTGVDADGPLGRHMLAALAVGSEAPVAFVEADLTGDAPIPDAPFDLTFARLLLLHVADPVALVRRLGGLTRPGGRLVLMDYDMTHVVTRPEHPALERAAVILNETFRRTGRAPDAGLRLPEYLAAAGLPAPRGTQAHTHFASLRHLGPMLRGVLASLATPATALGVTTADELAGVLATIEALEREGGHYGLLPVMVGVWTEI